jgi:hypothetical protein
LLFIAATALPAYFIQYRTEAYQCERDYCTIGNPGELMIVIDYGEPPVGPTAPPREGTGIFVRRNVPPPIALFAGLLMPIVLFAFAIKLLLPLRDRKR